MRRVEEIFAEYGPAVVTEVGKQMRRSGTLGPLLRQLGLEVPRTIDEQFDVLLQFVAEQGPVGFLNAVSLSDPANTIVHGRATRGRVPLTAPPAQPAPPSRPSAAQVGSAARSAGAPASPAAGTPQQASPAPPGNFGSASAPASAPSSEPAPAADTTGRKWINSPTYVGPDRRSGVERRMGPADRRASIELIYRNRRFGGPDRRKMIRREEDRLAKQQEMAAQLRKPR